MSQGTLRKLTRESVVYGLGQAVGRGLQMLLVPIFTRVFSPAEYGVIDVLALVTSIAAFLIVMGTDVALARFFYEQSDREERRTLVTTLAVWRLGLALGSAALLWLLAPWLSSLVLASPDYVKYVRIAAMSLPFTVFVFFQNDVLRVTFQPWKFIALNVLDTVAVAGLSILFVVGMHREVSGVFYARLVGDAIAFVVGLVLIRHSFVRRFRPDLLRAMLAFGVPLVPASVAFWAISYADRWFLVRYTDLAAVGVYAVAVKLGTLMMLVISAFQLAWGPFAYAHAHEPHAGRLFARVLTIYAAVASGLALLLGLAAPEALRWIVPTSYLGAAVPGALLTFGVVAYGGYGVAGIGANLAKRTEFQVWAALSAAVVTIALARLLVGPLRLEGVAIATLAGFVSSAILLYVFSQRVHPFPHCGQRSLSLFGLALGAWALASAGAAALESSGRYALGVALRALVFVLYAALAAFLARRIAPQPALDGPLTTDAAPLPPAPVPSATETL
ncbi:MAG: lipopolysaccharide biosynthesis protein [Candidatus Eisenbacteria bacterium]